MRSLRKSIEKYYLSIFMVSTCSMAVILFIVVQYFTQSQIDHEILTFTNDLIHFLDNPANESIAIIGKRNYSFQIFEKNKTYASFNVTENIPVKKEGFYTYGFNRVYLIHDGDYKIVVSRNIADQIFFISILGVILAVTVMGLFFVVKRFGSRLTYRLIKPIEEIGKQMIDISKGHARRIEVELTSRETYELQSQINMALEKLNSIMDQLREFASSISHQLRNPLATIKAQLEVTMSRLESYSLKNDLNAIMRNVEKMIQITSGLLLIARAKHQSENAFEEEDLSTVVLEAVEQNMQRFPDVEFVLEIPAGVRSRCISELLFHAFANLIENACKYTDKNKPVYVGLSEKDSFVEFFVSNHASPIPLGDRKKIFERFYRASNAKGDGLGLGLAIVKAIADLHHAKVEYVFNGLNTFFFTLPK